MIIRSHRELGVELGAAASEATLTWERTRAAPYLAQVWGPAQPPPHPDRLGVAEQVTHTSLSRTVFLGETLPPRAGQDRHRERWGAGTHLPDPEVLPC